MLINVALAIILIGIFAIIPCGCIFTRPNKAAPVATEQPKGNL